MLVLNLLNRIFGNKGDLSRSEIDTYVKDKRELQKIEEKSLGDAFNRDALEGFNKHGLGANAMKSLDAKMAKKADPGKVLYIAVFSAAAVVAVLLGTYAVQQIYPSSEQQLVMVDNEEKEQPEQLDKALAEENLNEEITDNNQDTAEVKWVKSEEYFEKTKGSPPVLNELNERNEKVSVPESGTFSYDDQVNFEAQLEARTRTTAPSASEPSSLIYKTAAEVYLHDFKLIDYRPYRTADGARKKEVMSGVPADRNDIDNTMDMHVNNDLFAETEEVSYISYIEETMKWMQMENHTIAARRFRAILEVYPDDKNAYFYLGIIAFENGEYQAAKDLFSKSYTLDFGNFYEEAQFHMAQCYIQLGQKDQAKAKLRRIIADKGFYKGQAEKLLKKL
jgi:TolA-binding protein